MPTCTTISVYKTGSTRLVRTEMTDETLGTPPNVTVADLRSLSSARRNTL
jgi:hypothetical protein